ncbi:uncharacterized protein TRIVIDRAFT_223556 [Trichoderma virens Gv29-8]|uniref:Hypervirulence associated protein TUDOR domain-containing protein n=1 Tax=Hypocrea virens (strain Gv29-8 / FGSC 10586) TaxID=413071 RepID=G9MXG4_HYPVG|nr:uncharacterized protein TRIVIDRAFT_223556 [Trichoderma virens Gv29-8]EHK20862.1 hypothetical protein TRIVIDRAFT_223556 [Trichoderma virens Gv29-8]UKZ56871.1 hypothetical protein TrVGV298_010716 [Trichoderma virens]UKZ82607.1 hypothetical protein TrVFT333_010400 [Trichoderma virens FT-333]
MPFAEGTSVTATVDDGSSYIGTVKSFQNGRYVVEIVKGDVTEVVDVDESKVKEFHMMMSNKSLFNRIGR